MTIEQLQGEVATLKTQLAAKDSEIRSLEKDVREREAENFKSREKLRDASDKTKTLEGEIATLKSNAPVKDGEVVLSKADAERWSKIQEAVKARNLKLDEISNVFTEFDTLKTKVAAAEREKVLRDVADAAGLNHKVLSRLAGDLEFEITESTVDGKATKTANVLLVDGDKKKPQPLSEYAKAEWAEMLPALQATEASQSDDRRHVRQPGTKPAPPATPEEAVKQEQSRLAATGNYSI